ncbi:hypothetical protein C2G38_1271384 [Gigaspora rosea]|uniref:histidine kinase n=1 Tax=Gigaspora rosea TaxID=44941 RepID=A0A397W640_9GLOM|nr:hypothetical protein C2G38_1271384 [Gigaspora rosea]
MSLPKNNKQNFINTVYNYDWSSTSLGTMDSWDPAFKNAVTLCLQTAFPAVIYAGPGWVQIYNEAYESVLMTKQNAQGKPFKEVWPEIYEQSAALFEIVTTTGKGLFREDELYLLERDGYIEEAYFNYTCSPIFISDGSAYGTFCLVQETTPKVLNARRLKILGEFGRRITEVESLESACHIITKILGDNNVDIPYAMIYLVNRKLNTASESLIARLITTTFDYDCKSGWLFPDNLPETPEIIDLTKDVDKNYNTLIELKREAATYSFLKCDSWPINLLIKDGDHIKVLLDDGSQAVLLLTKISLCDDQVLSAILICGINRRRTLDEKYMEFLKLITNQMNRCLLRARSIEEEKKRSKLLTELNHQKVLFFQGISHELKTPLTLMLSPLDDIINACPQEAPIMTYFQIIRRNAHRLLKLINTLLQFSNIESEKLDACYRETNIVELTQELVSDFKSMAETLGLDYAIDIPLADEFNQVVGDKVYLDHDMYETIVFNLCSNALKHTWNGSVTIRLYVDYKDKNKMIVLEISDTGVGIPELALPNIFQRFYRVESQSSRSHEGTGIGLALVKELVTFHGGDITVTSVVNKGTTFKCWFPIGCDHLPTDKIQRNNVENPISYGRELYTSRKLYLEESSQWVKNSKFDDQNDVDKLSIDDKNIDIDKMLPKDITFYFSTDNEKKYQILLVDDNNDMRDYLADLLKEFDVHRACDGQDAIRVLKKLNRLPDLVLSDIMMPNMNGYELLEILRSNVKTQMIPVILLSAKACEESRIKGLDKGADDYLIKPFSTRELIARIQANIELSHLRRKILFKQYKEEETKQLLLTISNKVLSGLDLNETLLDIIKEIHYKLPNERILIISNDQSEFKNNKIVALYDGAESIQSTNILFNEINNQSKSSEFLNNYSGVDINLDVYCDDVCKNVSVLSIEIRLNNTCWGWIKLYRSPNSIWLDSEIELLQQISNQISLNIIYVNILKENTENGIKIKAIEIANKAKSQILANTSHELRTPLGAIVGILSSFDNTSLTIDQNDMINIMAHASDIVLSIVNDILDAAKLEARKVALINRTFDLLELFEGTIENFGKRAGAKKIDLIVNCDVDSFPRYVKSDPDRLKQVLSHLLSNSVKFTDKGKIVFTVSMQLQEVIDDDKEKPTYGQIIQRGCLLIELYDTGIGMDPEYIKHAWQSFSQGDMSMTKMQDGTGLGLSICKNLVEINGGEIKVESELGKGSKFWFTWNVELLSSKTSSLTSTQFGQMSYALSQSIKQKRILIIHSVEDARNAMLNYLKKIEKVDAFDTFDKGIRAAKKYKELNNQFSYDIVFISLYETNENEVINAIFELRGLDMNNNNLVIIFIVFPTNEENELAEKLIGKVGGTTTILYTPITWKKIANLFMNMEKNHVAIENIFKQGDHKLLETGDTNQYKFEDIKESDSKKSKCILMCG